MGQVRLAGFTAARNLLGNEMWAERQNIRYTARKAKISFWIQGNYLFILL